MGNQKSSRAVGRFGEPHSLSPRDTAGRQSDESDWSAGKGGAGGAKQGSPSGGEMPAETEETPPVVLLQPLPPISLAIVDKSALFRTGLSSILADSRFRVFASCANTCELAKEIAFEKPAVVVVTLDKDADVILADAERLVAQGIRVLALSERFRADEAFAAIKAGINGYLLKNEINPDALLTSLELICLQGVVLPRDFGKLLKDSDRPEIMLRLKGSENVCDQDQSPPESTPADDLGRLSNRERMILTHLTQGASNKQIARDLNIAEATVKVYVKSLLRKIRVENRTQAAIWAIGNFNKTSLGILIAACTIISTLLWS